MQATQLLRLAGLTALLLPSLGAGMVSVPAGSFRSGCNAEVDTSCEPNEAGVPDRTLAAFSIDRTEVSVSDYATCVAAGACSAEGLTVPLWRGKRRPGWGDACNWGKPGRDFHPINCVDFDQARVFCAWAGKRLPGEWEWEKAARGVEGAVYPWGDTSYSQAGAAANTGGRRLANVPDRTAGRVYEWPFILEAYDDGYATTSPVAAFPEGASPYGALDMAGNVYEWTTHSARAASGEPEVRQMARGGSWRRNPAYSRTSNRHFVAPGSRNVDFGFRCARSGEPGDPDVVSPRLRALVVGGQPPKPDWAARTELMRRFLLETGRFEVDVVTTVPVGTDPAFAPDFSHYDVVVSNYKGADWPEPTRRAFVAYMQAGGGLVLVHGATTRFGTWAAFNQMAGLAGWDGRSRTEGVYLYYDDAGERVRDPSEGRAGHHSTEHSFPVVLREPHPITAGMPAVWRHTPDEIYDRLRGPAERVTVLATGWSDPDEKGSGRHEPVLFVVGYGNGRVVQLTLGHGFPAYEGVGFQVMFQRSAEWAATGAVTQSLPTDLPDRDQARRRELHQERQP